jgi:hypothetical protein
MIEEDKTVEAKKIDVSSLSNLFPNPKLSESTATCGYCVGRSQMAYLDGTTAAMQWQMLCLHRQKWQRVQIPLLARVNRLIHKSFLFLHRSSG